MDNQLNTLGKRVRFGRNLKGVSQDELARAVGCDQQTISALEVGDATFTIFIFEIAHFLNLSAEWLATGKERTALALIRGHHQDTFIDSVNIPLLARHCALISWEEAGLTIRKGDPELVSKSKTLVSLQPHDSLNSYALIMEGESMVTNDPHLISFAPGDVLVFNPELIPIPGDYVLARVAGERNALFRQYVRDLGRYYLQPNNKHYPLTRIDMTVEIAAVCTTRTSIITKR